MAGYVDRAADSAAEIVPAQRRNFGHAVDDVHLVGIVDPVVGGKRVVAVEFIERAMEVELPLRVTTLICAPPRGRCRPCKGFAPL